MAAVTEIQWFFKKEEMRINAGSNRIFIARDWESAKGRMVKQFASVASHEEVVQYIQKLYHEGADACLYELVRFNMPCKLYFDVEWTARSDADDMAVVSRITEFVDTLLQDMSESARKTPELRKCEILRSSRPDKKKGHTKHSFHLIYPGITFANNTVAMQRITSKVHARCAEMFDKNPVDLSVYTRDRLFRAPLCWKANDKTQTALRFQDGKHPVSRILSCFVTRVLPPGIWIGGPSADDTVRKSTPKPGRGQPREKGHPSEVFISGWKVNLPKLERRLQGIIREAGGMGRIQFQRIVESGGFLLFRLEHAVYGREEPCLAHGINSKVTHKNDNQLVSVDVHGLVRVICPHKGKCNRARHTLCKLEPKYFMSKA